MTQSSSTPTSSPSLQLSRLFDSASLLTGQSDSTLTFPSLRSTLKGKQKTDPTTKSFNQVDSLKAKLSIRLQASSSKLNDYNLLQDEDTLERLDSLSSLHRQESEEMDRDPFFHTGLQALRLLLQINQVVLESHSQSGSSSKPSTSTSTSTQSNQPSSQNHFGSRDLKSIFILVSLVFQFLVKPSISDYDASLEFKNVKKMDEKEKLNGSSDRLPKIEDGLKVPRFQEIKEETEEEIKATKEKKVEEIKKSLMVFNSSFNESLQVLTSVYFLLIDLLPSKTNLDERTEMLEDGMKSEWRSILFKSMSSQHLSEILDLGLRISFGPFHFQPQLESLINQLKVSDGISLSAVDRKDLERFSSVELKIDEEMKTRRESNQAKSGQKLKSLMNDLPTLSLLSALSKSSTRQSSSMSNTIIKSDKQTESRTPPFVSTIKKHFLSAQLLRKDGVKSLMEASGLRMESSSGEESEPSSSTNENANESESSILKKMTSISRLIQIPPKGLGEVSFIDIILEQLSRILGADKSQDGVKSSDKREKGKGKERLSSQDSDVNNTNESPILFQRCAVFCLVRISESKNEEVRDLLKKWFWDLIWVHFNPVVNQKLKEDSILVSNDKLLKSLDLLSKILENVEPSPNFITSLINFNILPQFFSLIAFIQRTSSPQSKNVSAHQSQKSKIQVLPPEKPWTRNQVIEKEMRDELLKILKDSTRIWLRLVDGEEGREMIGLRENGLIKRLMRGGIGEIEQDKALKDVEDDDERLETCWSEDRNGSICIKVKKASKSRDSFSLSDLLSSLPSEIQVPELANRDSTKQDDAAKDLPEIPSAFFDSLSLNPDPELLSKLLKDNRRMDLAHSLLIEVLDAYVGYGRERKRSGSGGAGLNKEPIFYLQMILCLFDSFGSEILHSDQISKHQAQDGSEDKIGKSGSVLTFINFALGENWNNEISSREASIEDESKTKRKGLISSLDDVEEDSGGKTESALEGLMNVKKSRDSAARSSSGLNESKNQGAEEIDGDLAETALTLLLALLEGDQSLNATSSPLLLVISSKISNPNFLELKDDLDFKQLVREARLVLTARFSASQDQEGREKAEDRKSTSDRIDAETSVEKEKRRSREVYQEALRLLQDPILPVRAHGLILLKDLLASSNGKNLKDASKDSKATVIEEALIPSILSIFLQAIQDDESYLYLNAVQGLAELGLRREDSSDRKMLDSLLDIYVGKDRSGGWSRENSKLSKQSKLSQNEADLRLRIGEALTVVIQSCGDRLSSHASRLISPLLTALRDPMAPTTFKSSIISILGTCVEAFPLALASNDLSHAMTSASIELLQIETVAKEQPGRISEKIKKKGSKRNKPQEQIASDSVAGKAGVKVFMEDADDVELDSSEEEREEKKPTQDSAISTDSKLPHLRRSALLLLNLLVRGTRDQLEIFTSSLEKFHSQRSNVSGDADLNMIFNRSKDRADENSFSSLRLPNGSILSLASTKKEPSSKTEEKSSTKEARPPSLGSPLFPLGFIPRTKSLVEYLSFRDNDELVRNSARTLLEDLKMLELDCLRDGAVEWLGKK